jgi:tRNA G18 (ribose-2'-O)-methylase SpoU
LDVHSREPLAPPRRRAGPNSISATNFFAFAQQYDEVRRALLFALFEPDIAQNTGAMMRTCTCLCVDAAIIEPAGFRLNDSRFRRAAMDYINALTMESHNSWASFAAWRAASQRRWCY